MLFLTSGESITRQNRKGMKWCHKTELTFFFFFTLFLPQPIGYRELTWTVWGNFALDFQLKFNISGKFRHATYVKKCKVNFNLKTKPYYTSVMGSTKHNKGENDVFLK